MKGAAGDTGHSLLQRLIALLFRSIFVLLAFAKGRIILRSNNDSTGWLPRLGKRGSAKQKGSRMSEEILRELRQLERRMKTIEGSLNNSTNTNARIRDRIKILGDRIAEIEAQLGIANA